MLQQPDKAFRLCLVPRCAHAWMCACVYVCMYACLYVCCVYVYKCCSSPTRHSDCVWYHAASTPGCVRACMHVCMCVVFIAAGQGIRTVVWYSDFHNDCLFLAQKKLNWYRTLRTKTEPMRFGSGIWTWVFFIEKKKDSHYGNQNTIHPHLYACVYVVSGYINALYVYVCLYACMYVRCICMYVCMHVCMLCLGK
jgi:hypothetical protein